MATVYKMMPLFQQALYLVEEYSKEFNPIKASVQQRSFLHKGRSAHSWLQTLAPFPYLLSYQYSNTIKEAKFHSITLIINICMDCLMGVLFGGKNNIEWVLKIQTGPGVRQSWFEEFQLHSLLNKLLNFSIQFSHLLKGDSNSTYL